MLSPRRTVLLFRGVREGPSMPTQQLCRKRFQSHRHYGSSGVQQVFNGRTGEFKCQVTPNHQTGVPRRRRGRLPTSLTTSCPPHLLPTLTFRRLTCLTVLQRNALLRQGVAMLPRQPQLTGSCLMGACPTEAFRLAPRAPACGRSTLQLCPDGSA